MVGFRIRSARSSSVGSLRKVDQRIPSIKSIMMNGPNCWGLSAAEPQQRMQGREMVVYSRRYSINSTSFVTFSARQGDTVWPGFAKRITALGCRPLNPMWKLMLNDPLKNPRYSPVPWPSKRASTKATTSSFALMSLRIQALHWSSASAWAILP